MDVCICIYIYIYIYIYIKLDKMVINYLDDSSSHDGKDLLSSKFSDKCKNKITKSNHLTTPNPPRHPSLLFWCN